MESKSGSSKGNIFKISIGIIIVALFVSVIIQNRKINSLKENNQAAEVESDTSKVKIAAAVEEDNTQNKNETQGKILITESKPAESNLEQGASGEQLQTAEENAGAAQDNNILGNITSMIQENPVMEEMIRAQLKPMLATTYETFAEEQNLSAETKDKLIDILIEKQLESLDLVSQLSEVKKGNTSPEDLKNETEWITKTYDEKISQLLSPKEFTAYQEYTKVEPERTLINEFNNIDYVGDHQIDKDIQKKLVAAMYDERQKMTELAEMEQESGDMGAMLSEDTLKKGVALQTQLYDNYLESASEILTESQMKSFRSFMNSKKSVLEMSAKLAPQILGISKEKKEEE